MKALITGRDETSKRILADLKGGLRVSAIPDHYPVSLDQAKRLSRYRNILESAKGNLREELFDRLQVIGLKCLPLSPLFRKYDWGGIAEILSVVTDETTREELQLLISGLEEKRKRIDDFKENADLILERLENADKTLRTKENELLQLQKDFDDQINIFKGFPEPYRSFLGEYLGLYKGKLVLARRLNVNWQRDLRKQGIIVYDEELHVHFLKDLYAFTDALKSRHERGHEYRWNPESDMERVRKRTPWADIPEDGKYKLPSAFNEQLSDAIKKVIQELTEIKAKRGTIETELKNMKKKTVHSYMEMAEVSNFLSTIDLKRHKELQDKALKWLFQRGFIAVAEFTLPNGKRADIFAYNESQIVIFEVKVSQGDLITDKKWMDYLPYCHEFYFLTPTDLVDVVTEKIEDVKCGQYVEAGESLKLIKTDDRPVNKIDQEDELKFAAGQLLSRKFIYGY